MFTSLKTEHNDEAYETAERLRFVANWFRVLGFILVVLWIIGGVVFFVAGAASRQPGQGLFIGVVAALVGILVTAPLYFWFAAVASGVATLVDRSARTANG